MALGYRKSFLTLTDLDARGHHCDADCEIPQDQPWCYIPCACGGRLEECPSCQGRGWEPIFVCPLTLQDAETSELVSLYAQWPGALLRAGGIYDQPAGYVEAMRILDMGVGILREQVSAEEERARKAPKTPGR